MKKVSVAVFGVFAGIEVFLCGEGGKMIDLPLPSYKGDISLEEAIVKRRSIRRFENKELTLVEISQLLWAAYGITDKKNNLRSSPSAGAIYPMEIFLVKSDGVFKYLPDEHKLRLINNIDIRRDLAKASFNQGFILQAPISIVICAVYSKIKSRYGERGVRYAHLEAGHIAQNIQLQSVALGLGSVCVGAFDDKRVLELLGGFSQCSPLYIIPVGYPKK